MTEPLYRIRNLTFSFDGRGIVLRIPRLEFREKAIQVLTGSNGSGKSTLLRLLNGLLPAPEDSIFFRGDPIPRSVRSVRARTVYVHQNPFLLSGTVRDNVGYGLHIRKVPRKEIHASVARALDMVGLPDLAGRNTRELSGGEVQRVALARALVLEPEVLLLDEPTANMDKASASLLEDLLVRLKNDRGVTVIMSSHDPAFARRTADEVICMERGEIA